LFPWAGCRKTLSAGLPDSVAGGNLWPHAGSGTMGNNGVVAVGGHGERFAGTETQS
jgi:hypothetical protein